MNKVGGRYYLQYAAPGTEYNVYATGTYVGSHPFGPFEYAAYNPVGYKPGGFVTGAGHGSTFQDVYGNWWNTGTLWIGYNWKFERRIALFPAAFSADGQMRVSTRFGDFPHYMPEGRVDDPESFLVHWMGCCLPHLQETLDGIFDSGELFRDRVNDENPRDLLGRSARNEPGQTLTFRS